MLRAILFLLGFFGSMLVVSCIFLYGASHFYASSNAADSISDLPIWIIHEFLTSHGIPGFSDYGPIHVETANAWHAIRNLIFLFSISALGPLLPLYFFVVGLIVVVAAPFTGQWIYVVYGLLAMTLGAILIAILALLVYVSIYLIFLFQPCTVAYFLIILLPGLISQIIGLGAGATPLFIVAVFQKSSSR